MSARLGLALVGNQIDKIRWNALQQTLQKLNLGLDLMSAPIDSAQPEAVVQALSQLEPQYVAAHVSGTAQVSLVQNLAGVSAQAYALGACDTLYRSKRVWWPRALLTDAITECLHELGEVETSGIAMVAGAGGRARLAAAALARVGFKRIQFVDVDRNLAEAAALDLSKRLFGCNFGVVDLLDVTTLPGVYSVLVNTEGQGEGHAVLEELSFFNFMTRSGAFLDLVRGDGQTNFQKLAEEVGIRVLPADIVDAHSDRLLVELVLGQKLNEDFDRTLVDLLRVTPKDQPSV